MRWLSLIIFLFPVAALAGPAAQSDYLAAYAGYFDITQDDDAAAQFGLEYRYNDIYHGLRPGVGFNVSTDEAFYGYAGFFWDLYLSERWVFTPNIVAGGFSHGDGKDLGHGIEFRSGVELSYQFHGGQRLGLNFNHISNASIGDRNPGAETLFIIYQHPLSWGIDASHRAKKNVSGRYQPSNEERWWR